MGIQVTKIGEFKGHQQSIYAIASMDELHFLSVGGDGMLVKWHITEEDGMLISRIPEPIFCLAYNAATKFCALGTRSGSIYEIDTDSLVLQRQWKAHSSSVFDLVYSDDELLSCAEDGKLKRWKPNETNPSMEVHLSEKSLRCMAANKEQLWLGGSEGKVWQLDINTMAILSEFVASDTSVFALLSSGDVLFTAGRNARLHAWEQGKEMAVIDAHWYTVHALSQSRDGKYIASGSMDKSIKIWDAKTLELLKVIDRERYGAHKSSVNKIIWLDPTRFLSCSDDRMIYYFEINHKSQIILRPPKLS